MSLRDLSHQRQVTLKPFCIKGLKQLPRPARRPQQESVRCHAHCRHTVCAAETEKKVGQVETKEIQEKPAEHKGEELENPESEASRKKDEADRLRAAEKFMKIGTGEAVCKGCGYDYKPAKGDPEYPISPGTYFRDLPQDWNCPICGAGKNSFENRAKELAGFEENMGYGLGTNTMTSGQKSILIYGSLLFFFALFCAGYLLQ